MGLCPGTFEMDGHYQGFGRVITTRDPATSPTLRGGLRSHGPDPGGGRSLRLKIPQGPLLPIRLR
jgi:hypothetical protein